MRRVPSQQVIGVPSDEDIQKAEQRNPGSTTKGKRPRVSMGSGSSSQAEAARTRRSAKSLAPKSPGEQTETGKQITGALEGLGQGLAALFSEKPAGPQQERPVLPMKSRDYVEKGTYGQYQPGEIMNRARSNRELFRQVQTMPVTAYDPRPRKSQELMDYVSEGTEGQFNHWAMHSDTHPAAAYANRKPQGGDSDPEDHDDTLDYVEDATEGQWGENDQKWGLIRMGMDARDQERSKQERANGSRGHFDAGHT